MLQTQMMIPTDVNLDIVSNLGCVPTEEMHTKESKVICDDILYMIENISMDRQEGISLTEDAKKLIVAHLDAFKTFIQKEN